MIDFESVVLPYYKDTEYSSKDDYYFLNHYKDYCICSEINKKLEFNYSTTNKGTFLKFDLIKIAGKGNELSKLSKLKKWAESILHFSGKPLADQRYDGTYYEDIIFNAQKDGFALNCRYISFIFTQILLSAGFKARWVICKSMDLRDTECHCVTEVFVNTLDKWIVIDPAFRKMYFNRKGDILNLVEIRQLLAKGENIRFVSHDKEYSKVLQLYWIKNSFRFCYCASELESIYNSPKVSFWCLNPKGYKMINRTVKLKKLVRFEFYDNVNLFY